MNSNKWYSGLKIEYHVVQSFPVTCLNRDDVGAPKSAVVGGVPRARVSSQSWKRQVRLAMRDLGVKVAVRTKQVGELVDAALREIGADEEAAIACAEVVATALTRDTLHFISNTEVAALADYVRENDFDSTKLSAKEIAKVHKASFEPAADGLDIALFGRMVAQATTLNVEAAASFSHAISTHRVSNEIEFFTALDDLSSESGSAHMGSLEFNSATYYRYISINVGQLVETLRGDEYLGEALTAFTKALFLAQPAARQTTQSGASPWDYARILVRKGQRVQASFDEPVKSSGLGFANPSVVALDVFLERQKKLHGSLYGEIADLSYGADDSFSIDDLVDGISHAVQPPKDE